PLGEVTLSSTAPSCACGPPGRSSAPAEGRVSPCRRWRGTPPGSRRGRSTGGRHRGQARSPRRGIVGSSQHLVIGRHLLSPFPDRTFSYSSCIGGTRANFQGEYKDEDNEHTKTPIADRGRLAYADHRDGASGR